MNQPRPVPTNLALDAEVRQAEPDLWLASRLVADPARRSALVALFAAHVALGQVAGAAANPLAGDIRLAWWREEVEALFGSGRALGHPALQALRSAQGLSQAALEAMIEARHAELDPRPFEHETQLLLYLDGLYGGLMRAAAALLEPGTPPMTVTEAARAFGLARLSQDRPAWLARGRDWTPLAWGDASDAEIAAHIRHRVADALGASRAEITDLPTAAFPAVAAAALAHAYAGGRRLTPLEKRLRLIWAALRGRV